MRKISRRKEAIICARCGGMGSSLCATPECNLSKAESRESIIPKILAILAVLVLCTLAQAILGISIPFVD